MHTRKSSNKKSLDNTNEEYEAYFFRGEKKRCGGVFERPRLRRPPCPRSLSSSFSSRCSSESLSFFLLSRVGMEKKTNVKTRRTRIRRKEKRPRDLQSASRSRSVRTFWCRRVRRFRYSHSFGVVSRQKEMMQKRWSKKH